MTLQAHFSNQTEALLDALCRELEHQPPGPFDDELLIVPSAALQRWLTWQLAQRRGIAANLRFAYLAPWLLEQVRRENDPPPLGAAAWPWKVYQLLASPKLLREQPRLAQSLGEPGAPGAEALRWERAQQLAQQLERLGLERPDWLAAWRERRLLLDAPHEAWQAALWRAVGDEAADLLARAQERLDQAESGRPVHLFAPPRLAPLHQRALQRLARRREVRLYLLNPCREYWFDLVSPRRLARLQRQGRADATHEVLHPLLAHWAEPTQTLLRQAAELDLHADEGDYRQPRPTLLGAVQRSLLDLSPMPQATAPGDRSLEVHRAHSLRRELEVLHDRLLGLVAEDPSLQLSDVLVLLPDLDAAAPLIHAVFASSPPERALAYEISGQTAPPLTPWVAAFLRALQLLQGPAAAGDWLALCAALELQGDEATREAALQAAGHRAGLGMAVSEAQGLSPAHSLEAALQRLVLAHCLPLQPRQPPLDVWRAAPVRLPADELAALRSLAGRLIAAEAEAQQPLLPARWIPWLQGLLAALIPESTDADSPPAEAARQLRRAIAQLAEAWAKAGLTLPLPLARVRAALEDALHDPVRGGVAGGAISFSSLTALRGVPARVIAVLGLDDGAWPRAARQDPTDLLAAHPRAGDRQPRAEARQALLDALLAAREHLHLSCTGFSARDGSALPPSPLITELLDALGPELARAITVDAPMQPFSPLAFDPRDPRRQSFRAEWMPPPTDAGTARVTEETEDETDEAQDDEATPLPQPPYLREPLAPQAPPARVTLAELLDALRHPARAWLQRRLDLRLPWDESPWDEAEPFALASLDLSAWVAECEALLMLDDDALLARLVRSDPRWPAGALGEAALRAERAALRTHAQGLAEWEAAPPLPRQPVALPLRVAGHGVALQVEANALRLLAGQPTLLRTRYTRARAGERLQAWAAHLAMQAAFGAEAQALHRGERLGFAPVADPLEPLQVLAELAFGWSTEPPPLPLRAALALVEGSEAKAREAWSGGLWPERDDTAWRLLQRGAAGSTLGDPRFAELAQTVFGPLVAHQR